MTITWTLEQNDFGLLADRLEREAPEVVTKVTADIHGTAVNDSPYDTGNLAGTHQMDIAGLQGMITVEAFYGLFVHEGHRTRSGGYVAGRPWFRVAFDHYQESFQFAVFMLLRPR